MRDGVRDGGRAGRVVIGRHTERKAYLVVFKVHQLSISLYWFKVVCAIILCRKFC